MARIGGRSWFEAFDKGKEDKRGREWWGDLFLLSDNLSFLFEKRSTRAALIFLFLEKNFWDNFRNFFTWKVTDQDGRVLEYKKNGLKENFKRFGMKRVSGG